MHSYFTAVQERTGLSRCAEWSCLHFQMKVKSPKELSAREAFDVELESLVKSIDPSRKRNLSAGLLRRDQAVDRLAIQEASASPVLKKLKPNMALTREEFLASMRDQTDRITARLDNVDGSILVLKSDLTKVNNNVTSNTSRIDKQDDEIRANRVRLASLEDEVKRAKTSDQTATPVTPRTGQLCRVGAREEKAFLLARRPLRLWPVEQ